MQKDGRVFISSALLNGKFILRFSILSFRTHLDTVKLALKILGEKVEHTLFIFDTAVKRFPRPRE